MPFCTNKMVEATKGIVHRDVKGAKKDFFLVDYWLSSKKSAEAAMYIGADMIGLAKTNKRGL